jgi:hypothetical protein
LTKNGDFVEIFLERTGLKLLATTEWDYNIPEASEFKGEEESEIKTGRGNLTFRDNRQKPSKNAHFQE